MRLERGLAWGLAALCCLGCGGGGASAGGKKPAPGKKKGGGDPAAAAKVVTEVRDWWAEHQLDWKGLQAKVADARKRVKDKDGVAALEGILEEAKPFIQGALEGKVEEIGKNAFDPANAQYWEKYLGQYDALEKQLAEFEAEVAAANAPKIAEWRGKIVKRVFEEDVIKFVRSNRTEVEKVLAKLADWRGRVTKLGDAGQEFLTQIDSMETSTKELTGWMERKPPGHVNLLDAAHRGGWQKHGMVDFTFEGDELVVTGTGTEKKDFGLLLHNGYWWTDCEIEITFENQEKGFQLVARAHPPRSGDTQSLPAHVFEVGRTWSIFMKLAGETVQVGGDSEEKNSKFTGDPGGGIALYVGPGAKVKILKLEATPAGASKPAKPEKSGEDPEGPPPEGGGD
jgi:hypothetical protein